MRTLIVNSYHAEPEKKIEPYVNLVRKFSEYNVAPDISVHLISDIYEYDALILSGSPTLITKGVYSKTYLEFLKHLTIPTLGICYGHQMLALAFGAEIKEAKWVEGLETVWVIDSKDIFQNLAPEFSAAEAHQEYVALKSLDRAGFIILANSGSCEVEAIRHIERPLYGVQFHPERSGEIGETIFHNFYQNVVTKRRRLE